MKIDILNINLCKFQNKRKMKMSFKVLIALLNTELMIMIKKGSGNVLADENLKCDSLMVGYSSLGHGK